MFFWECTFHALFSNSIQIIYTKSEVHFFRLLQRDIVLSPDGSIRSITALNLTNALETSTAKLTKTRAQELIEIWCDEGYFIDADEVLAFGPKTQAEFGHFLKTSFPNEVYVCSLCKLPIFKVSFCSKDYFKEVSSNDILFDFTGNQLWSRCMRICFAQTLFAKVFG